MGDVEEDPELENIDAGSTEMLSTDTLQKIFKNASVEALREISRDPGLNRVEFRSVLPTNEFAEVYKNTIEPSRLAAEAAIGSAALILSEATEDDIGWVEKDFEDDPAPRSSIRDWEKVVGKPSLYGNDKVEYTPVGDASQSDVYREELATKFVQTWEKHDVEMQLSVNLAKGIITKAQSEEKNYGDVSHVKRGNKSVEEEDEEAAKVSAQTKDEAELTLEDLVIERIEYGAEMDTGIGTRRNIISKMISNKYCCDWRIIMGDNSEALQEVSKPVRLDSEPSFVYGSELKDTLVRYEIIDTIENIHVTEKTNSSNYLEEILDVLEDQEAEGEEVQAENEQGLGEIKRDVFASVLNSVMYFTTDIRKKQTTEEPKEGQLPVAPKETPFNPTEYHRRLLSFIKFEDIDDFWKRSRNVNGRGSRAPIKDLFWDLAGQAIQTLNECVTKEDEDGIKQATTRLRDIVEAAYIAGDIKTFCYIFLFRPKRVKDFPESDATKVAKKSTNQKLMDFFLGQDDEVVRALIYALFVAREATDRSKFIEIKQAAENGSSKLHKDARIIAQVLLRQTIKDGLEEGTRAASSFFVHEAQLELEKRAQRIIIDQRKFEALITVIALTPGLHVGKTKPEAEALPKNYLELIKKTDSWSFLRSYLNINPETGKVNGFKPSKTVIGARNPEWLIKGMNAFRAENVQGMATLLADFMYSMEAHLTENIASETLKALAYYSREFEYYLADIHTTTSDLCASLVALIRCNYIPHGCDIVSLINLAYTHKAIDRVSGLRISNELQISKDKWEKGQHENQVSQLVTFFGTEGTSSEMVKGRIETEMHEAQDSQVPGLLVMIEDALGDDINSWYQKATDMMNGDEIKEFYPAATESHINKTLEMNRMFSAYLGVAHQRQLDLLHSRAKESTKQGNTPQKRRLDNFIVFHVNVLAASVLVKQMVLLENTHEEKTEFAERRGLNRRVNLYDEMEIFGVTDKEDIEIIYGDDEEKKNQRKQTFSIMWIQDRLSRVYTKSTDVADRTIDHSEVEQYLSARAIPRYGNGNRQVQMWASRAISILVAESIMRKATDDDVKRIKEVFSMNKNLDYIIAYLHFLSITDNKVWKGTKDALFTFKRWRLDVYVSQNHRMVASSVELEDKRPVCIHAIQKLAGDFPSKKQWIFDLITSVSATGHKETYDLLMWLFYPAPTSELIDVNDPDQMLSAEKKSESGACVVVPTSFLDEMDNGSRGDIFISLARDVKKEVKPVNSPNPLVLYWDEANAIHLRLEQDKANYNAPFFELGELRYSVREGNEVLNLGLINRLHQLALLDPKQNHGEFEANIIKACENLVNYTNASKRHVRLNAFIKALGKYLQLPLGDKDVKDEFSTDPDAKYTIKGRNIIRFLRAFNVLEIGDGNISKGLNHALFVLLSVAKTELTLEYHAYSIWRQSPSDHTSVHGPLKGTLINSALELLLQICVRQCQGKINMARYLEMVTGLVNREMSFSQFSDEVNFQKIGPLAHQFFKYAFGRRRFLSMETIMDARKHLVRPEVTPDTLESSDIQRLQDLIIYYTSKYQFDPMLSDFVVVLARTYYADMVQEVTPTRGGVLLGYIASILAAEPLHAEHKNLPDEILDPPAKLDDFEGASKLLREFAAEASGASKHKDFRAYFRGLFEKGLGMKKVEETVLLHHLCKGVRCLVARLRAFESLEQKANSISTVLQFYGKRWGDHIQAVVDARQRLIDATNKIKLAYASPHFNVNDADFLRIDEEFDNAVEAYMNLVPDREKKNEMHVLYEIEVPAFQINRDMVMGCYLPLCLLKDAMEVLVARRIQNVSNQQKQWASEFNKAHNPVLGAQFIQAELAFKIEDELIQTKKLMEESASLFKKFLKMCEGKLVDHGEPQTEALFRGKFKDDHHKFISMTANIKWGRSAKKDFGEDYANPNAVFYSETTERVNPDEVKFDVQGEITSSLADLSHIGFSMASILASDVTPAASFRDMETTLRLMNKDTDNQIPLSDVLSLSVIGTEASLGCVREAVSGSPSNDDDMDVSEFRRYLLCVPWVGSENYAFRLQPLEEAQKFLFVVLLHRVRRRAQQFETENPSAPVKDVFGRYETKHFNQKREAFRGLVEKMIDKEASSIAAKAFKMELDDRLANINEWLTNNKKYSEFKPTTFTSEKVRNEFQQGSDFDPLFYMEGLSEDAKEKEQTSQQKADEEALARRAERLQSEAGDDEEEGGESIPAEETEEARQRKEANRVDDAAALNA